jgi:hypothetical protein
MTNRMVSTIIVLIPITKLIIRDPVSDIPKIFLPRKYPQMKAKNIRLIKPKPNAIVNLNSYLALTSSSSSGSKNLISLVIS